MTKIQERKLIVSKTKKFFFLSATALTAALFTLYTAQTPVRAKSISKQAFAGGLVSGCKKNRSTEICLCYAKAVVSRYNESQLDAMYRQMKLEPESRKMFFLVHAAEMNECMTKANK